MTSRAYRKYLQTLLEVDGFEGRNRQLRERGAHESERRRTPDFIILDVLMPELNGIETLKELMQIDRSLT